jgi:hypothetical protein
MDPHTGRIVLNGAPSQYSRLHPSASAARARVDGRSPEELRAFAVQVAGLVNFYALDDRVDGDWTGFFLADPVFLEASMGAAAPAAAESAAAALARRVLEEEDPERKRALLRALAAATHTLARQADAWLAAVRGLPAGGAARRAARLLGAAVAEELAPALRKLRGWDEGAASRGALGGRLGLDYAAFAPEWEVERAPADPSIFRGPTPADRMDAAVPHLVEAFGRAAEAVAGVGEAAAGLADGAPPGTERPQAALLDAFVRLFGTAQATLDTIAPRYAEFYYREVLREPERGPVPDALHLAFALEEDAPGPARVPRGTLFPAGADADGAERIYAADRSLPVSAAALARVRMLRRVEGPLLLSSPSAPQEPVVRQVMESALAGAAGGTEEGGGWPTFGADAAGSVAELATVPATLGFAVAAPELLLAGGRRFVAVSFRFTPDAALTARLEALAGAVGLPPWKALGRVMEGAFRLQLSTAEGWLPVDAYHAAARPPAPERETAALTLGLDLPASVAAVVPLHDGDPAAAVEAEGPDPAPGLPTLRGYLRPGPVEVTGPAGTAAVYPLSLLEVLGVRTVEVRVRVRGLPAASVANTDGEVDPAGPFTVFGGSPAVGSYLELRAPELFAKVPVELAVTLRWLGLPPNEDGFRGWYRDYVVGLDGKPQPDLFDNATFRGRWSVANPGPWRLATAAPGGELPYEPVYLFRSRGDGSLSPPLPDCTPPEPLPDTALCTETRFDRMPVARRDPPAYYDPRESALRLELSDPPYAFGADLYAVNVLNSVIADLPDAGCCRERCLSACEPLRDDPEKYDACITACMNDCMRPAGELHYPNAPYLPQAEWVAVDYAAGCRIDPAVEGRGGLYHLTPFGGWTPAPPESPLLPLPAEDGSLLLGFTGLEEAQALTLLFRMEARGPGAAAPLPPPVGWSVLAGDRWRALPPDALVADGTHGLRGSGIVALEVPAGGRERGTLLPGEERWLRAAVDRGAEGFPWTVSIHPHALTATWRDTGDGAAAHLAEPVPAGTVTSSVEALPGIGTIVQPLPSFGGRAPEVRETYQVRLGERLRHKERAVQGWDYERLVLERFPQVWMAAALPARGPAGPAPGATLVVVVAGEEGNESADPTVPRAPGTLLGRIEAFLAERATPFARVRVVNPVYVRVRVEAEVVFRAGPEGGDADRLDAELVAYLSPWFYDAARAAREGRYASEADVSEFIQSRPYVESLLFLELAHEPAPEALEWYFLTSAERHLIREPELEEVER